jgi:ubiquitin-activating enzyme E1
MLSLFSTLWNIAAKNVILAGVKSVVLHDTKSVQMLDLGANFYFSESDIGKNRAFACATKLQELNTAVSVTVNTSEITEELLSGFQVSL